MQLNILLSISSVHSKRRRKKVGGGNSMKGRKLLKCMQMLQMLQVITCCYSFCCCNTWQMPLNVNVNGKVERRLRLLLLLLFVVIVVMFPNSFFMLHYSHQSQSQSWLGLANLSRHLMGLNGERIRSMQSRFKLVNIKGGKVTNHREGGAERKTCNRAWQ